MDLKDVIDKVNNLEDRITNNIEKMHKENQKELRVIKEGIFGNGGLGLKTEVMLLKKDNKRISTVVVIVIAAFVTTLVGLLITGS